MMKTLIKVYAIEIYGIFSFAAVLVYSWSMLIFFWDLPSYLLRLSAGDILGILSYHLVLAFLESAIVATLATGFALLLPSKKDFSVAGSLFIAALAGGSLMFKGLANIIAWISNSFAVGINVASQAAIILMTLVAIGGIAAALILPKSQKTRRFIKNIIENLATLSGLYVMLSIVAFFIFIYRNIY